MKYLKLFGIITIVELIAWLLFSFSDLIDEFLLESIILNLVIGCIISFVIPILYLIFEKRYVIN